MLVQCPRCGLIATVQPRGRKGHEASFKKDLCEEAVELAQHNGQPSDPNWFCQDLQAAILEALPTPRRPRKKPNPPLIIPIST